MNKILEAKLPFVALKKSPNSYNDNIYKDEEKFAKDLTENVNTNY